MQGAPCSLHSLCFYYSFLPLLDPGLFPCFSGSFLGSTRKEGRHRPLSGLGVHTWLLISAFQTGKQDWGKKPLISRQGHRKFFPGGPAELAHSSCGLSANGDLKITNPAGVPHFHLSPSLVLPPTPYLHAALSVVNQQG